MKKTIIVTIVLTLLSIAIWFIIDRRDINSLSSLGKWIFLPWTSLGICAMCFSLMGSFQKEWRLKNQIIYVRLVQLWGIGLWFFALPWGLTALLVSCGHTVGYTIRKIVAKKSQVTVRS